MREKKQLRTIEAQKRMYESLVRHRGVVTEALRETGVSRAGYYLWLNTDDKFRKMVEEIGEIALDFAEDKLLKQIEKGDTIATIFYLKTKGKKRGYVERTEIDATLSVPVNIQIMPASQFLEEKNQIKIQPNDNNETISDPDSFS